MESPGKQPRQLAVPAVRDRVLQTAAALVLTPLFEAEFEDCSFAYRRGRSVDQAVRRIMQYRDQGFRWVVDADIASFFAEIDQERLVREVAGAGSGRADHRSHQGMAQSTGHGP